METLRRSLRRGLTRWRMYVRNSSAPQRGDGEGVYNDLPNGGSELVLPVNRGSKTRGVGTRHLKMSDLFSCFHLSDVNAAKKLGVSQTTLKNACRKFGLKRWPGREHSPEVRTAGLYKRLYYHGWRSKYHSAGRHDMITLDTGNPTKRASGLALPTTRKYRKAAKENQQRKGT